MKKILPLALLALSFSVSPVLADQVVDTVIGASAGGLIGSTIGHGDGNVAATAAGVVIGGAIGNEIGRPSSYSYSRPASLSVYDDYPDDMFPHLHNDSPYRDNYVAPPGLSPHGYCQPYKQQTIVGGTVQNSSGTMCLGTDNAWHVVD